MSPLLLDYREHEEVVELCQGGIGITYHHYARVTAVGQDGWSVLVPYQDCDSFAIVVV